MGITNRLEDLVVARWGPGARFTLDDVVVLAAEHGIKVRSTVRRTTQELRNRGVLQFINDQGDYRRLATSSETDESPHSQVLAAQQLRDDRFEYRPQLQAMVNDRLRALAATFSRQRDTSLRDIPNIIGNSTPDRTETSAKVMTRLGQGQFRDKLITYWQACAVTGCDFFPILRASHIQPWRVSNDDERLDVFNGLLLIPNLDALFDAGLITFDDSGRMAVSNIVSQETRKMFRIPSRKKLAINDKHLPYLNYHRAHVFAQGATDAL